MPLVEVRNLVKHFERGGGLLPAQDHRQGRRRCELFDRRGRDLRAGRRIGQRQEHDRPLHAAARRSDLRRSAVSRRKRADVLERPHAGRPPRHADGLSGSVLVAQPADARLHHRRRAAGHSQDRVESRTARTSRRAVSTGRPRPLTSRSLSARVQRRPASTHRSGAGARPQSVVHHRRRAGVGAGRLDSGAGHQPA